MTAQHSPFPSGDAIGEALRERLPSVPHAVVDPLAALLADLLAHKVAPEEAEQQLRSITFAALRQHLAGQSLAADWLQLDFAPDGDAIHIGDITQGKGIAIGRGANAQMVEGSSNTVAAPGGIAINLNFISARPAPTVPFMACDLPADFVPRPDEFEQIVAHVLGAGSGPVAISAALRGAGGFGKTTLATAVCHDQRVRGVFPEGVLWVTLGERLGPADLVARATDLIERLTGSRPGYSSLEAATSALAETLGKRRLLLVLDDVWDAAHLQPFLQGGPLTVRLITTRNRDTLPLDVHSVDVDAMRQIEAVNLLAAGLIDPEKYLAELRVLAERLGEWPLLLKLVNGALHEQVGAGATLAGALAYVREGLDEEGITVFDTDTAEGRSRAVARTLTVSLATLSADEQRRFAELAIFPENVVIPVATLQRYWGMSSFKARQLCGRLAARSLLLSYDGTSGIRLHGIVRTYLIHAAVANLLDWHRTLLQVHRPNSGDWADLPEHEPYLWAYLVEHLRDAGLDDELLRTLKDPRYLARKTVVVSIGAVEADLAIGVTRSPQDAHLLNLARQIGKYAHLLARCPSYEDCATTLAAHLWASQDFGPLCQDLIAQLPAPTLVPLHPFADTTPGLLRTLKGHTDTVWSGVFSPDGQLILSASDDGTLILWETASGKRRHTLKGHTDTVWSGVFSPDGQLILSASQDKTLILWEVTSGKRRHTLESHTEGVRSGVFSPDGRLILSASGDGTLILWEVASGKRLSTLRTQFPLTCAAFGPDGDTIVIGDQGGQVLFLRIRRGEAT
jgi:hypothetical protein